MSTKQIIAKLLTILIILSLVLSSCSTIVYKSPKIPIPPEPVYENVIFVDLSTDNCDCKLYGVFLDYDNARALNRNLIEMKYYIKSLVDTIKIFSENNENKGENKGKNKK